jgi:hypothetical protein
MATTEAKPEAKPEPKEIEESSEPLLKYKVIKTLKHGFYEHQSQKITTFTCL